jgi:glycerol kinase
VQSLGLYDFRAECYWDEWLAVLGIPRDPLPEPVPTKHHYGALRLTGPDGSTADVPVMAMIGNEQAALLGHGCYHPGDAECTHGTASFVDVCLGAEAPVQEKLNVYYAWHLGDQPTYCLEADTTVSGAAIRWMKEQARLFDRDEEVGPLAASVPDSAGVIFVPAFTGLNVPYNDRSARGTIFGLTLGSSRAHIVRAFLESLGYQVRAILETITAETGLRVEQLSMGGGIAKSDEACQIQADLVGMPIVRPTFTEMSARAAALLAGLGAGVWTTLTDLPPLPGDYTIFEPRLPADQRDAGYARWQRAVERVQRWRET